AGGGVATKTTKTQIEAAGLRSKKLKLCRISFAHLGELTMSGASTYGGPCIGTARQSRAADARAGRHVGRKGESSWVTGVNSLGDGGGISEDAPAVSHTARESVAR